MIALKTILYVEDEPDIRDIAKMALESLGGYEVTVCESGKQALETLAGYTPQLILLDVMMPHMDGPTTLQAIRELPQAKSIPVVFMTAKVQQHEVARYLALGSIGVISKPFDAMLLSENIKELWNKFNEQQ